MKSYLKLISIILAIATFCVPLFSCSGNLDNGNESDESFSDSDTSINKDTQSEKATDKPDNKETEKIPSNAYLLFQDGEYTVKAIMPDKPTDIENTVYAKLRSRFKSKTGTTLQTNTDYLKSGEKHSTTEPEVLIGLTNYTESKNVYEDISYGTYGIKFLGKKIVFYFEQLEELKKADEK